MKRVLVTGAAGMLGVDVCRALESAGIGAIPTDRAGAAVRLDVTNLYQAGAVIDSEGPDAVIHCAAYTQVDRAESERDDAFRVNAVGSRVVAIACAERGIPVCAVSTDFVFDGANPAPYTEFDPVGPLSVYGASKLAAEVAVREVCRRHWIVRTSWLFGLHGRCFPDTILKAASARTELTVVADQRGTPTFTQDLAAALVRLIQYPVFGTYHLANAADGGSTTWHEFARLAVDLAGLDTSVRPITTAEWPTPARRPANSALRCYMMEMQGLSLLRPWQEALQDYLTQRKALSQS